MLASRICKGCNRAVILKHLLENNGEFPAAWEKAFDETWEKQNTRMREHLLWCAGGGPMPLWSGAKPPDDCPFLVEHIVATGTISDLSKKHSTVA